MTARILNLIKKDFTIALRNNMIIYAALFPILLAVGMNFFIPSVTEMETTIAVEAEVEDWVINRLESYGKVELFSSTEAVRARVNKIDNISGILRDGEQYVVLLEGNEPEEARDMARAVMNQVLSKNPSAKFTHLSLNKGNSAIKEIMGSLLLLTAVLIAGYVIGMNIVEEKETGAIMALDVSPLKLKEFIYSHTLVSVISGVILAVISTLILVGTDVNYWLVVIAVISTMGVGIAWGFLIGGIADNLLGAIAVIKSTTIFFLGIPLGSVYIPASFRWVLYPFPNYWAFEAYRNIFNGGQQWIGFGPACIITLVYSLIIISAMRPMLRKKLRLR